MEINIVIMFLLIYNFVLNNIKNIWTKSLTKFSHVIYYNLNNLN